MKKKIALVMLVALFVLSMPVDVVLAGKANIPGINIVSVVPNQVVTIETVNFPSGLDFDVIIGPYGELGRTGYKVATTNSGAGGRFTVTYNIPPEYKDAPRLAIRLTNASKGYFAYNWFDNVVPTPKPTSTQNPVLAAYKGHPSIKVSSVESGKNVTIDAESFPPKADLSVVMSIPGTRFKQSYAAGSANSGETGTFTSTFTIPQEISGLFMIAIKIQDPATGYYAYNWFFNLNYPAVSTAAPTVTAAPSYAGEPAIEFTTVVKGTSVTLKAGNLPLNETFEVYMGDIKSLVSGGVKVAEINSGESGEVVQTYNIPAELNGLWQISVRVVSTTSGVYGYNWFYNQTYP